MKTFILFWNPEISSYKFDDYQDELEEFDYYCKDMNWSVWDHDDAHAGDRFFMVRCGAGNTGICMSGYFSSEPYAGEDWAGRDKVTYYINLEPDVMIHPEYLPILTTNELASAIPSFDWNGGHSGRLLDEENAKTLEDLWEKFIKKNEGIFTIRAARQEVDPSDFISSDKTIYCYLSLTLNGEVDVYNYHYCIDKSFATVEKAKKFALKVLKKEGVDSDRVVFRFENIPEEVQPQFTEIFNKYLALNVPKFYHELIDDDMENNYTLSLYLYCLVKFGDDTFNDIFKQKFPDEVKKAVKALLQLDEDPEKIDLKKIAPNELARDLKYDMLKKELEIAYLDEVTVDDLPRLNKALRTLHLLKK